MLIQGKERRCVEGTHEPLVDAETFEAIQKAFHSKDFHLTPNEQPTNNILKARSFADAAAEKCSESAALTTQIGISSPAIRTTALAQADAQVCMCGKKTFSVRFTIS